MSVPRKRNTSLSARQFGAAMRARMTERRSSLRKLEKATGIYRSYLHDIEHGYREVRLEEARKIAEALDAPELVSAA